MQNKITEKNKETSKTQDLKPFWNTIALKAKYAFYSTLVFFLLASPETYLLTSRLYSPIADTEGHPSPLGLFIHTGLFFLVLLGLMMFPRDF